MKLRLIVLFAIVISITWGCSRGYYSHVARAKTQKKAIPRTERIHTLNKNSKEETVQLDEAVINAAIALNAETTVNTEQSTKKPNTNISKTIKKVVKKEMANLYYLKKFAVKPPPNENKDEDAIYIFFCIILIALCVYLLAAAELGCCLFVLVAMLGIACLLIIFTSL